MLFTFLKIWWYYLICIICWYLFNSVTINTYGGIIISDFFNRHSTNDTNISTYFLMWTSSYYIPMFFAMMFFLYTYWTINAYRTRIVTTELVYFTLFLVYSLELVDFIGVNFNATLLSLTDVNTNSLLINQLNRYHPVIFYLSVINLLKLFTSVLFLDVNRGNSFIINTNLRYLACRNWIGFNIITLALYLGSWWACQEGNWGGWWNSDSSEMFGLLIFISNVTFVHRITNVSKIYYYKKTLTFYVTVVLIFYYFLQLNYELTSHNFGSKFFFFFNNNLFYIWLSVLLLMTVFKLFKFIWNIKVKTFDTLIESNHFASLKFKNHTFYLITWGLVNWVIISLLPLTDLFNFKYKHEFSNIIWETYNYLQFTFMFLLTFVFFKSNNKSFVFSIWEFLKFQTPFSHMFTVQKNPIWLPQILHLNFIIILFINFLSNDLLYLYNLTIEFNTSRVFNSEIYDSFAYIYVCSTLNSTKIILCLDQGFNTSSIWTFNTFFNFFECDAFSLTYNNKVTSNCLYKTIDYVQTCIYIDFSNLNTLNLAFVLSTIIWLITYNKFTNKLILY